MASVFEDVVGTYDLLITTSADWTVHAADLPNGDAAVSLSTTLNQNAYNASETPFALTNGAGTEVNTLEVWVKITADTTVRTIAIMRTDGTSSTTNDYHWECQVTAGESVQFAWYNTAGGNYLVQGSGALAAGWHHLVFIINHGSTRSIQCYADGVSIGTSSSTSGTPTYDTTAAYRLFVGSRRTDSTQDMTDHMAKLAWYNVALTGGQITAHYNAMVP